MKSKNGLAVSVRLARNENLPSTERATKLVELRSSFVQENILRNSTNLPIISRGIRILTDPFSGEKFCIKMSQNGKLAKFVGSISFPQRETARVHVSEFGLQSYDSCWLNFDFGKFNQISARSRNRMPVALKVHDKRVASRYDRFTGSVLSMCTSLTCDTRSKRRLRVLFDPFCRKWLLVRFDASNSRARALCLVIPTGTAVPGWLLGLLESGKSDKYFGIHADGRIHESSEDIPWFNYSWPVEKWTTVWDRDLFSGIASKGVTGAVKWGIKNETIIRRGSPVVIIEDGAPFGFTFLQPVDKGVLLFPGPSIDAFNSKVAPVECYRFPLEKVHLTDDSVLIAASHLNTHELFSGKLIGKAQKSRRKWKKHFVVQSDQEQVGKNNRHRMKLGIISFTSFELALVCSVVIFFVIAWRLLRFFLFT
jgi:hypothetical protein